MKAVKDPCCFDLKYGQHNVAHPIQRRKRSIHFLPHITTLSAEQKSLEGRMNGLFYGYRVRHPRYLLLITPQIPGIRLKFPPDRQADGDPLQSLRRVSVIGKCLRLLRTAVGATAL